MTPNEIKRKKIMAKWTRTNFPGVRYREHPTRKNGIQKDRYFTIRYKVREGDKLKDKEEGLGWSSEGWTAAKAYDRARELKENRKVGDGPQTLAEKRDIKKAEDEEARQDKQRNVTFQRFWLETYFPISKLSKKASTCKAEEIYYTRWIEPVIGDIPLGKVSPFNIEQIKKNLLDAGRSARTIEYITAIIRQVWNLARRDGLVNTEPPTRRVRLPKVDNRRLRFLTHEEADKLLESLKSRSLQTYRMALLSLHSGLRAGEIFALTWGDVDIDRGLLTLRDTKNSRTRTAYMTGDLKTMLQEMDHGKKHEFVFPDRHGKKIERISNVFQRTVKDLKLNAGIADKRQRVVFHALRHSYASWLVESGVSLYAVKELLGHRTLSQTERYSHLSESTLQNAVNGLQEKINKSKNEQNKILSIK